LLRKIAGMKYPLNFLGSDRSILSPKNHYVKYYTKPENYIKFIPSPKALNQYED